MSSGKFCAVLWTYLLMIPAGGYGNNMGIILEGFSSSLLNDHFANNFSNSQF